MSKYRRKKRRSRTLKRVRKPKPFCVVYGALTVEIARVQQSSYKIPRYIILKYFSCMRGKDPVRYAAWLVRASAWVANAPKVRKR